MYLLKGHSHMTFNLLDRRDRKQKRLRIFPLAQVFILPIFQVLHLKKNNSSCLCKQLLEEGKVLAEEFSSKKPSPKKRKKNPDGSNVSWRKRDRDGNIVPRHIRKPSDRPVSSPTTKALPEVTHLPEEIQEEVPSLVCLLPISVSTHICPCGPNQDFTVIPGKQTVLVTINGPYNLCLPVICCPLCSARWTPGMRDLLEHKYWPGSMGYW
ncbi:uncharacterized protein LOC121639312 [Melanotaenia boesemani]|uniref:uncharacterized protein LOC121639312 n=1 Tax=Melanotaenia boesemani TaxID=1250792 RepID=UPI001C05549E|nr:uncharacterized protein LOC121639312 [Melanotaenia boesemani]